MRNPSRRCVPLGVLPRLGVVALFAFVLTGCGGGDSSTPSGPAPPPPPPPPPPATLDFSAIAGDWAGVGDRIFTPAFYQIEITVVAEVAVGDQAGAISYEGTENDQEFSCEGELVARLANGNTYEFTENITSGGCFTGNTDRLIHDAAAGTLNYEQVGREGSLRSGQLVGQGVLTRKE